MRAFFTPWFGHFFNHVITKKFEIALGHLICRFAADEIPKNKRRVA